jgi:acyl-CoA-binding protein
MTALDNSFQKAVAEIRALPTDGSLTLLIRPGPFSPSNAQKLKLYALFKQATKGDCKTAKPKFYDLVGKAKW